MLVLVLLYALTPSGLYAAPTLLWSDEFDGSVLDETKWTFAWGTGSGGWGNNESEFYTNRTENIFLKDGHLVIQALKEEFHESNFTSGRIFTKNKADFIYGKIEVRAKLPYGKGLWPAIWMLPTDYIHGPGIASGEMDIMELLGHEPNKMYSTAHYGRNLTDRGHKFNSYVLPKGSFADAFHVFSLNWEETGLVFAVDNHIVVTVTRADIPSKYVYPYDAKFYILLNVAVGGNWPGYPDRSTHFPQKMEVDYVRVYSVDSDSNDV